MIFSAFESDTNLLH